MGLVLARGAGDILADDPQPATRPAPPAGTSVAQFPDGEARAFAISFARAFLTVDPRDDGAGARRLASLVSPSLSDQAAPSAPPRSPGAEVAFATVAREVHLGESRALITVAVFLRDGRTRYLTVPVARDAAGGLVVYDLPSFSAAPAAGAGDPPAASQLSGPDGEAVGDLAARFLRVYLQGGSGPELAYLTAAGVHVAPMQAGLEVEAVEEVARLASAGPRRLQLAATVRVRERATRASYRLRYRLTVERADRWQVVAVAGGPES